MSKIVTERLILRPLAPADAAPLFRLFGNWAVIEWLSAPPWPYARADMDAFMARQLAGTAPDDEVFLVIERAGAPIGGISTRRRSASHLQSAAGPNIGYWLGADHWGQGCMSEAAAGLVRHIFATTGVNAIYSGAFTGNTASLRVQSKLGFARDGETMLYSNPQKADLPHTNTVLTRRAFETSNFRNSP